MGDLPSRVGLLSVLPSAKVVFFLEGAEEVAVTEGAPLVGLAQRQRKAITPTCVACDWPGTWLLEVGGPGVVLPRRPKAAVRLPPRPPEFSSVGDEPKPTITGGGGGGGCDMRRALAAFVSLPPPIRLRRLPRRVWERASAACALPLGGEDRRSKATPYDRRVDRGDGCAGVLEDVMPSSTSPTPANAACWAGDALVSLDDGEPDELFLTHRPDGSTAPPHTVTMGSG